MNISDLTYLETVSEENLSGGTRNLRRLNVRRNRVNVSRVRQEIKNSDLTIEVSDDFIDNPSRSDIAVIIGQTNSNETRQRIGNNNNFS